MKMFKNFTFSLIGKSRILALILFFSSSMSILAVNNLSVSGAIGSHTATNGTYTYQGLDGNSHNYWKHSTNTYYIYWNNTWSTWELGTSYTDYHEYIVVDELEYRTVNEMPYATPDFTWSGNNDFLGMTMAEVDPVPVELATFTANIKNKLIELNWQTATEVNNYGFEVERSQNDNWQKIGFVQGHGNSNSPKEYTFTDKPNKGSKFKYRLKQIDFDGQFEYSSEVEVDLDVPANFSVKQNFPNPFNPTTKIEFSIPIDNNVEIKVFNVIGMEVATLLNEQRQAGTYNIEFNASNLSSGIYFYKITSGKFSEIRKMILLR